MSIKKDLVCFAQNFKWWMGRVVRTGSYLQISLWKPFGPLKETDHSLSHKIGSNKNNFKSELAI